ncbi:MAG: 30S ribosomal protein S9 [Spirochaetia bacterium]|nr:30S ribosomal protein S9 [Spirochaetia bacterium]
MSTTKYGTGRRKTSIARVWVKPGTGKVIIKGKPVREYFERSLHVDQVLAPLSAISGLTKYDVEATAQGGGKTGQAGAIRMGIARALAQIDESMHTTLSKGGFLTRDSRMVERKKYGRKKARRSFQFSKR